MALKAKKVEKVEETKEAVVEEAVEGTVEETTEDSEEAVAEEVAEEVAEGLNEDEKEVLSNGAGEVSVANTRKLELANELLAHQFNIDETFYLTKVADTGKTMTLGFANMDYEVTIKIKDTEEMGLI